MKHKPQELSKTRQPEIFNYNGRRYIAFRDVFYNLVSQNIDYDKVTKSVNKLTTQPMSPKHRKRLQRQLKRKMGLQTK